MLTYRDCEDLIIAVNMRMNWIETGDVVLSQADAIDMRQPGIIKRLEESQKTTIARLQRLRNLLMKLQQRLPYESSDDDSPY